MLLNSNIKYASFGSGMKARTWSAGASANGFNGKRKDDEIDGAGNVYDYGARMYDARLARPVSTDPLFRNFAALSPYQFFSNSPIAFVDFDGQEGRQYLETTINLEQGTVITNRIVEVDVYVAVSDKASDAHYSPSDIPKIKSQLNTEFNTGTFTDANGNKVVYRFNVKAFNADAIIPELKAEELTDQEKSPDNFEEATFNGEKTMTTKGFVLRKQLLGNSDNGPIQGKTSLKQNLVVISADAYNPSHTKGHETTHWLRKLDEKNTPDNHKDEDGILKDGSYNEETKTVDGTKNFNKNDNTKVLEFVPKVGDKINLKLKKTDSEGQNVQVK